MSALSLLLLRSCSPSTTDRVLVVQSSFPFLQVPLPLLLQMHTMQWAAVTTHWAATRVPPHPPGLEPLTELKLRDTIQGYLPGWG